MKPILQRLTVQSAEGFAFKAIRSSGFDCPWHVHPEYELIQVVQGRGYRIVGDNISRLSPGDLVMVGPGLPHIWQDEHIAEKQSTVHFLLIQFQERILGEALLGLSAMEPVRRLLHQAKRGLHIVGKTRVRVSTMMKDMANVEGMERIVKFLQILTVLAASNDCKPIASVGFVSDASLFDQERMDRVFQLRIGRACVLLQENNLNVTEVAYESGCTNRSNFNRQFLKLKGLSPRRFRLEFQQRLSQARFVPLP
ncbi:MAG: AraC family transcriptional regulator [Verrucomicrobia bacterium]|nr:AraC family transcriptional regulator [Verrucomicrobiota bacterium]